MFRIMLEPSFLRRQAARLKALAAQLADPQAAAAVAAVVREIEERARELEQGEDGGPEA